MRYVPAQWCGKACAAATRGLSMLRAAPTRAAVSPGTESRPRRVWGYPRVLMGETSSCVGHRSGVQDRRPVIDRRRWRWRMAFNERRCPTVPVILSSTVRIPVRTSQEVGPPETRVFQTSHAAGSPPHFRHSVLQRDVENACQGCVSPPGAPYDSSSLLRPRSGVLPKIWIYPPSIEIQAIHIVRMPYSHAHCQAPPAAWCPRCGSEGVYCTQYR
jgi:hypothetical protein